MLAKIAHLHEPDPEIFVNNAIGWVVGVWVILMVVVFCWKLLREFWKE